MSAAKSYDNNFPSHVGIIMDGNGRWAAKRHQARALGHQEGVRAVRRTVEAAGNLGIKHLTLFSFSTENWSRPKAEISALFRLLQKYVASDLEKLHANNVKVSIIGSRQGLSPDIMDIINNVEETTRGNDGFYLNIAFNYGGRDEIVRAVKAALSSGASLSNLTEDQISEHMDTAGQPDPDLIIRTSGEQRTSNFLLWQSAYSEYIFMDVLWPDFGHNELEAAILEYQNRDRRFGAVTSAEVA